MTFRAAALTPRGSSFPAISAGPNVVHDALPHVHRGNGTYYLAVLAVLPSFPIAEQEQPVLDDRAARGRTVDVADQLRTRRLAAAVGSQRTVKEEIVGRGGCIAVIPVQGAVQVVGAALGQHHHLRAGRPAAVGVGVQGRDAEFLH